MENEGTPEIRPSKLIVRSEHRTAIASLIRIFHVMSAPTCQTFTIDRKCSEFEQHLFNMWIAIFRAMAPAACTAKISGVAPIAQAKAFAQRRTTALSMGWLSPWSAIRIENNGSNPKQMKPKANAFFISRQAGGEWPSLHSSLVKIGGLRTNQGKRMLRRNREESRGIKRNQVR